MFLNRVGKPEVQIKNEIIVPIFFGYFLEKIIYFTKLKPQTEHILEFRAFSSTLK